ncbi:MAG TPA: glycosyltransferase family 9 protein [Usitatibacter sp.]|nr:glycosyltransferase family 9 protein [Usitatibacter sp.]
MGERTATRALAVTHAIARSLERRKEREGTPRFLVAHNLLLGDTLMLTPLLAKLRANHPQSEITLLAAPGTVPLYEHGPYRVRALAFKPSDSATTRALLDEDPFHVAFVIGDNRYSWLAAAMRARRIVVHSGDPRWSKNVFVDEARPYASKPTPWGAMVAALADGEEPPPFAPGDWRAPGAKTFAIPSMPYAVLHVGASTPLKQWPAARWMALAEELERRGYSIAWSAGRGEEEIVRECDPAGRHASYAGRLDLAQLWHLVANARLLVAPDTGVAHLGRVTFTPTVALFGPGSAALCAPGEFWKATPWRAVGLEPFHCRDQQMLFGRRVEWVRRCSRTVEQCSEPRCMNGIDVSAVLQAIDSLGAAAEL